jgi:hypothetical protein
MACARSASKDATGVKLRIIYVTRNYLQKNCIIRNIVAKNKLYTIQSARHYHHISVMIIKMSKLSGFEKSLICPAAD